MSLKEQLEVTLSYFEPMSLEMIYIDLESDFLNQNRELTIQDLKDVLSKLEKEKRVKVIIEKKHKFWIKKYPQKNLWRRIKNYLSAKR